MKTKSHPQYIGSLPDWQKWRLTYEGGDAFIATYLEKFSKRESDPTYEKRKKLTYNPAFAAEAVDEIKNSIFQRLVDITREGGSETYQRAVKGLEGGVDLASSSMNSFIGNDVLIELLTMSKVGVYVDMPSFEGKTLASIGKPRPYMYTYKVEDILNWTLNSQKEPINLLLQDHIYETDDETGLPIKISCRYKHLWLTPEGVAVRYYKDGEKDWEVINEEPIILDLKKIPFHIVDIPKSLLNETANYQIALLNLASSDIFYAIHSNFPFYVEQYNDKAIPNFTKIENKEDQGNKEIEVGAQVGRRYPRDTEKPGFIHPSPEPLEVSMAKQDQMKKEIRQLVALAVSNLRQASAESKDMDLQGLEAGLSYIGLVLENAERKISEFWSMYESSTPATVNYPEKYDLKTEEDRRKDADQLKKLIYTVPSKKYAKIISKQIAKIMVGNKVSTKELLEVYKEIDKADGITAEPEDIAKDLEIGVVDQETASRIRGYPDGVVEKAKQDHIDRLTRIAESQSDNQNLKNPASRGISDLDPNTDSGETERKQSLDTSKDATVKNKQRGKGRFKDEK